MIVNIKSNLSLKEIENILSEKRCHKYPLFHSECSLGINWVNNSKNFLCCFYEDGSTDRWGCQDAIKSFFYGKVIKINDKYRIIGITCVNAFFVFTTILFSVLFILGIGSFNFDSIFGILFFILIIILMNLKISKGNKLIKNHLEKLFQGDN